MPNFRLSKRALSQIVGFSLSAVLILSFQNCGKMAGQVSTLASIQNLTTSFDAAFFSYPYQSAPEGFSSAQFAAQPISGSSSKNIEAQFSYAFADSSETDSAISYGARLVNENDFPICPGVSGTFDPGQTTFSIACESLAFSQHAKLIVTISKNGKIRSVETDF